MGEPVKRDTSIEEASNGAIFVPLSTWVVPIFARLKISPNMVSVLGMLCGSAGGIFYYFYDVSYVASLIGFFLMAIWHVMDGADGQLARLTNSQSEIGKIIDGICDYVVFVVVYVAITMVLMLEYGPMIWILVVPAGFFHAIQAGAYELQRQEFDFWGLGKQSADMPDITSALDTSNMSKAAIFDTHLGRGYARMQNRVSGLEPHHRPELAKYLKDNPHAEEAFRRKYQLAYAPLVRGWGIMCSNYRTYTIFVSCIIGYPEIFFILEALVLPFVHYYLARKQRKFNVSFLKSLFESPF